MTSVKSVDYLKKDRFAFFQEFLKHPLQIGSIIPSSRFLERRIVRTAALDSASTIVELGSGTGGTTRAVLRAMPQQARLLSIEINPYFHSLIRRIEDSRLIAHFGNACNLKEIISMYGLDKPEVIISGIPFSTMNHSEGSKIVEAISTVLAPNGRFVAYQVSRRVVSLCRPYLGTEEIMLEFLNFPPMYVYKWDKSGA